MRWRKEKITCFLHNSYDGLLGNEGWWTIFTDFCLLKNSATFAADFDCGKFERDDVSKEWRKAKNQIPVVRPSKWGYVNFAITKSTQGSPVLIRGSIMECNELKASNGCIGHYHSRCIQLLRYFFFFGDKYST